MFLPARAIESFTVIGPDLRPVDLVDEYLAWLTDCERSPNTVEAYAYDLRAFWTFLTERELVWDRVGVMELGEFAAWARRPAANVVVLAEESARLSARTVNRMLSGVVGFCEFQARRGSTLAKDLVVKTRSGRGGYRPFLHGIARARPRGRAVRLPERRSLPQTLSLEQVAAVIDCQRRLRDRFLFALLASTGMRIGQALGLRHEDVVAWERRVVIRAREDAPRPAHSVSRTRDSKWKPRSNGKTIWPGACRRELFAAQQFRQFSLCLAPIRVGIVGSFSRATHRFGKRGRVFRRPRRHSPELAAQVLPVSERQTSD